MADCFQRVETHVSQVSRWTARASWSVSLLRCQTFDTSVSAAEASTLAGIRSRRRYHAMTNTWRGFRHSGVTRRSEVIAQIRLAMQFVGFLWETAHAVIFRVEACAHSFPVDPQEKGAREEWAHLSRR